jgi:hypothetical protein
MVRGLRARGSRVWATTVAPSLTNFSYDLPEPATVYHGVRRRLVGTVPVRSSAQPGRPWAMAWTGRRGRRSRWVDLEARPPENRSGLVVVVRGMSISPAMALMVLRVGRSAMPGRMTLVGNRVRNPSAA